MEEIEEKVSKYGRTLIINFYTLTKMTGMYDSMNEAILTIAQKLAENLEHFLEDTGEFAVKTIDGAFYIEGIRVKTSVSDVEAFSNLAEELKKRSIGVLNFKSPIKTDDIVYLAYAIRGSDEVSEIQSALESKLTKGIEIGGPVFLAKEETIDLKDSRALAKRGYLKAIAAAKEIDVSLKGGRRLNLKNIKRALQMLVDAILKDEGYVLGLTTIRDIENYYYLHPVNVAILSTVLGKRIGFNKLYLSRLATSAFFHDLGKSDIPLSILNKKSEFTLAEMELIKGHSVEGVKKLLRLSGLNDASIMSMLVCFEHHMRLNLSGYPQTIEKRRPNIFSRIISIADDYDSLVSGKVYSRNALRVEEALKAMLNGSGILYDASLMKLFIGIFK